MGSIKLSDILTVNDISIVWTGTASNTGVRKQQLNVKGIKYDIEGTAYMEKHLQVSTSNTTTVTFTNAAIESDSFIGVAVSDWSLVPENVSVTSGTCVVTLPKAESASWVYVRINIGTPATIQPIVG